MALDAAEKKQIMEKYATHPGDTGSPEVQVALLSRRIALLVVLSFVATLVLTSRL